MEKEKKTHLTMSQIRRRVRKQSQDRKTPKKKKKTMKKVTTVTTKSPKKENKEDRERGEVDSKQEEKDPLVTRTQALKAIQELAAGVPLERLSGSTQTLLSQEGASGGYQMDEYSRQGLGDEPTDLVIDLEREGESIEEEGAGTSLPYHSVAEPEASPPTASPIGSIAANGRTNVVTSTPTGKGSWALKSPEVTMEPDEASSILSSMESPRPEGNFEGFKSKFVATSDILHLSSFSGRINIHAKPPAEVISLEGSQPHRPDRQLRPMRQAKSKLKPPALKSLKPLRTSKS